MQTVTLTDIGDPHVHFRQNMRSTKHGLGGEERTGLLDFAVLETARWASFALPMPNTIPSIRTGADFLKYRHEIQYASDGAAMHIIPCIKAVEGFTTPKVIQNAWDNGVRAIKVYFEGVTTNANEGDAVTWDGFFNMIDVWRVCECVGMKICIHPEKPKVFVLDREFEAHDAIEWLSKECPKAEIVVEHVTDRRTLELVDRLHNAHCTITTHHLWDDLDMVIGGNLNPHAFCKPIAKYPEDCRALRDAMLSGNPKFMFGSDTAPHPRDDKEREGCAGVFTGPFCPQIIAHILEEEGCEDIQRVMQGFMGDFARAFYNVPKMGRSVKLVQKPFTIPKAMYSNAWTLIVPFLAGEEIGWTIEGC